MFCDAVHQLTKMNPLSFEFNSRFLAHIAAEVFTGRHFEFVQNGEHFPNKILKEDKYEEYVSVFDDIDMNYLRTHYLNKGYMSLNFA